MRSELTHEPPHVKNSGDGIEDVNDTIMRNLLKTRAKSKERTILLDIMNFYLQCQG